MPGWLISSSGAPTTRVPWTALAMDGTRTVYDRQGWWHITSLDGGETWTRPVAVITGKVDISWYAHFEMGASGTVHMAAVTHQRNDPSPLGRSGVYYARLEIATGLWRDAAGSVLATGRWRSRAARSRP